ncbi:hypothetical protein IW140_003942 [Coemansia sp. RSA 1813]|nr:hypothetical protein EV178_003751 [Coemansia sp. RSA 1646]KAJ1766398.1 hypothetical protein LPJ74_005897 [Coemansia sp. RSA 1843]KAJ2212200.1 hypothetical protein EV179_004827 [Coemansia sp. RSA 487]KAJ2568399.1 hypothetical protein IW140_003942 [Coemansia sp. RSA 1813]
MPPSNPQSPKRPDEPTAPVVPHNSQAQGNGNAAESSITETNTGEVQKPKATAAATAGKSSSPKSPSLPSKNEATKEGSTAASPTKNSINDAQNASASFSQAIETAETGNQEEHEAAGGSSKQSLADEKENDALKATERDRELVEEFEYLLEKSQQLFLGLSDLPEIGSKYWMPHFQRTFEVFTKLWRFQNQHRLLLEKPEHYGLKRWEVGEIASKIGQLYYRYYLRTSETNYLQEAYVFYDAIRERNYFKGEQEVRNSALMIKKLRYYARFIVVCLQLGNTPMMLQLLDEVKSLIDVYSTTFNPVDKMEWSLVVKEMALFMQAVCSPVPTDENGILLQSNYRLASRKKPRFEKGSPKLRLQEAVIVGNRPTQIKFSELTLDMYHVLQMLEREPSSVLKDSGASGVTAISMATEAAPTTATTTAPTTAEASAIAIAITDPTKQPDLKEKAASNKQETGDSTATAAAANGNGGTDRPETAATGPNEDTRKTETPSAAASISGEKEKEKEKETTEKEKDKEKAAGKRTNPHKYVLYQPSFSHIQVYIASAFKEIGDQGCVLLYLSSEGSAFGHSEADGGASGTTATHGYIGGISTSRRNASDAGKDRSIEQLVNTVHPADLVPYTRKPFFLIVESESAAEYKNMPNLFNQPLLCLLSPTAYPNVCSYGNIYTFFLYSPIVAFSVISQISKIGAQRWTKLESLFSELEDVSFELINTYVEDQNTRRFLSDDFLRQIMCRHVLCCAILKLHLEYSRPEHQPQSAPESFADVISAPALLRKVRDVVEFCSVEEFYKMDESLHSSSSPQLQDMASPQQPETIAAEGAAEAAPEKPSAEALAVPPAPGPDLQPVSADGQDPTV